MRLSSLCFLPFWSCLQLALLTGTAFPAPNVPAPRRFTLSYGTTWEGLRTVALQQRGPRPRIGLALAGGGAKAAASIGVLKVLWRENIPVVAIAGTSMGAIVGGFAAAGYAPDEIEAIFLDNDWNDLFTDTPARVFLTQDRKEADSRHLLQFSFIGGRFIPPAGLTAGQKLTNILSAKTVAASFQAGLDFDRLPVPFRAVATDIVTGEPVVLKNGLLHDAMRASAAIPVIFSPVEIGGRLLVDGGLSDNLPTDVVKDLGVDVVLAVDASAQLAARNRITTLVDILGQSISLPIRRTTEQHAALADVLIMPQIEDFSFADFGRTIEIIRAGEQAAEKALPQIRSVLASKSSSQKSGDHFAIAGLDIRGAAPVRDAAVRLAFSPALARDASAGDITAALADVYRLGWFSDVHAELVPRAGVYDAVLTVAENPVVRSIAISGTEMIPRDEITRELAGQLNEPLNVTHTIASLKRIVQRYRDRGFLLVRVVDARLLPDTGTLAITLAEGRVDVIRLTGQRRTKLTLIDREMDTKTGMPLNFTTLNADIQHLYGLGFFESLSFDLQERENGGVALILKIREKPRGTVRLGLRYDLDDAFTGLTDLTVDNLGGRGVKLFLNTRYGNYTDITLGYHSPIIVNTFFVHTLRGFYLDRTFALYADGVKTGSLRVSRLGADLAFGYQWFRFGDTYLRYRFESDRTTEEFGTFPFENPTRIGSLAFLSTIDTRDSGIFPHRGFLVRGSYETAAEAYGGDIDFRKTTLAAEGALPLGERSTVLLDLSAGFGSGTLPYQEQFGIGGETPGLAFPLPGYRRREFIGANELGAMLTYRILLAEYQLKPAKALYLVLAGGAANVWDVREEISTNDVRKGADIGLQADTVIGPIRLDFGAGEDRRYLIYFSAGFDF